MLTVGLPVIGIAYLIRLYTGRAHWAVAILFGLLAWAGAFFSLIEFTQAQTPLNMSFTAALIGAVILGLPSVWGASDTKKDENTDRTENSTRDETKIQKDILEEGNASLSDLPKLKSSLEETRQLQNRLEERKNETDSTRYQRLHQRYEEEVEKIESEIERLTEQGTTRKMELEDRLSYWRNQAEEAEDEFDEIDSLYEGGAIRRGAYEEEIQQLEQTLDEAERKAAQAEKELDEIESYLNPTKEDGYRKSDTKRQKEIDSTQRLGEKKWKQPRKWGQLVFGSWLGWTVLGGLLLGFGYLLIEIPGNPLDTEPPIQRGMYLSGKQNGIGPEPPIEIKWKKQISTSALAVVDGIIYGVGHDGLYALEKKSGQQKWRFGGAAYSSGFTIAEGTIYTISSDYIYAIDRETGRKRWEFEAGSNSGNSFPELVEGNLYFGDDDGNVYALNAETGQLQWSFESEKGFESDKEIITDAVRPIVAEGITYVMGVNYTYALDARTGHEKWRFNTGVRPSRPVVDNSTVYVIRNSNDTPDNEHLYALNAKNGREQWSFTINRSHFYDGPTVLEGTVYLTASDGYVYALSTEDGKEKWRFETNHGEYSLEVTGNKAYLIGGSRSAADTDYVYSLSNETGKEKWRFEVNNTPPVKSGYEVIGEDVVYVGRGDGEINAIDVVTGKNRWQHKVNGSAETMEIGGGAAYIGSTYPGHLYALE